MAGLNNMWISILDLKGALMHILSFQTVNSERISGILEEEGGYYRFYVLCNGDSYMRRIPVPGPLSHKEFEELHIKLDRRTKFHNIPVEVNELKYDNLKEIYDSDPGLHANEPIGGFPEPAMIHPDLIQGVWNGSEVVVALLAVNQ